MIKKISILVVLILTQTIFAQRPQKVGYIDRDYILENVPEYQAAQKKLDAKITNWNTSLNKMQTEIEAMKLKLSNERALLTADLITEREEDINIKETEFKTKKEAYFGTSGDLFMLRKQLVKPVQDQIFNAVQEIVKTKKYDIIFDKASDDLVMLYSNPKYDVSELVLQKIVKGRKKKAVEKKKSDNQIAREKKKEANKTRVQEHKTKQEQLQARIKRQNEAKAAKRAATKKANEEKRAKQKAAAKAKREALKNKHKKPNSSQEKKKSSEDTKSNKKDESKTEKKEAVSKKTASVEQKAKTKAELNKEKRQKLVDRANAKKAKHDSLRKVAADKRAKKLAEIEARKKKLEKSKNKNN